jgi:hypothetical protein
METVYLNHWLDLSYEEVLEKDISLDSHVKSRASRITGHWPVSCLRFTGLVNHLFVEPAKKLNVFWRWHCQLVRVHGYKKFSASDRRLRAVLKLRSCLTETSKQSFVIKAARAMLHTYAAFRQLHLST